ncbi:hypothetical protein D5R40_29745 [Okeania hirsuta]|uniref:Uncharacterized protein n=1 Tax=Okeania hirsuta TaxID=1458930 RepID=A0A3N6R9W6_9CYAN|nr:hypothetical protein D5R40_29745 [Okeania hirsuta]
MGYIKITVNSGDKEAADNYQYAVQELAPRLLSFENQLNNILVGLPVQESTQSRRILHLP